MEGGVGVCVRDIGTSSCASAYAGPLEPEVNPSVIPRLVETPVDIQRTACIRP
jgi:hypothetical protein